MITELSAVIKHRILPNQVLSNTIATQYWHTKSHQQHRIRFTLPDMAGPPNKKQKREDYKNSAKERPITEKKFYRQRAHANPFSDHQLV